MLRGKWSQRNGERGVSEFQKGGRGGVVVRGGGGGGGGGGEGGGKWSQRNGGVGVESCGVGACEFRGGSGASEMVEGE